MKYKYNIIFSVLASVVLSISCTPESRTPEESIEEKILYYPSERAINAVGHSNREVDLDSLENYNELIAVLDTNACADRSNVISFNYQEQQVKISVLKSCSKDAGVGCYFNAIIYDFQNDSLALPNNMRVDRTRFEEQLIADLDHYINRNSSYIKPPAILIGINYTKPHRSTSTEQVKNTLLYITGVISNLSEDYPFDLRYYLNLDTTFLPPPPPPPFKM